MKQLVQNLKNGDLILSDMPIPLCKKNGVVVKNFSSLISFGTESSIINMAKKGLIGKARERPDLFKRAYDKAKKEGFFKVFNESMKRLDEPFPLGYSASGIVVETGRNVNGLNVGDYVATCGGGFASHAEYNYVPKNLVVPLPKRDNGSVIDFEEASFGMVGAIALHGLRETGVTPGETVLVIGLGLIGLITIQLVRAIGCFPIGLDIDPGKLKLAEQIGFKHVYDLNNEDVVSTLMSMTKGQGADATIITAATTSNSPIELSQKVTRSKGRIELVGVSDIC